MVMQVQQDLMVLVDQMVLKVIEVYKVYKV